MQQALFEERTNGGDMTLQELYTAANEMCQRWWGVPYTGTIRLMNQEWKSYYAYYYFTLQDDSIREIRMSRKRNAGRTKEEVLRTLLHELVHWRMHTTGQPRDDTDVEFVAECIRVGASLSGTKEARMAVRKYAEKMLSSKIG